MPGVMNSQTRGIQEQKKQLNKINNINFNNPIHAKLDHHSVHGKKYHRKENNQGEIKYIPKNLLPFGSR